jgi:hypothetical protein
MAVRAAGRPGDITGKKGEDQRRCAHNYLSLRDYFLHGDL